MVTEFRQIVFPMPVLREALDDARSSSDLGCYDLPAGTIVGVRLDEDVTLLIDAHDGSTEREWSLTAAEAGAALIRWCLTHRVVLPRAGDKRLSIVAGLLCLEIYIPGGADPLPPETVGAGLPFEASGVEEHFDSFIFAPLAT